jgi:predicted ferric reductase
VALFSEFFKAVSVRLFSGFGIAHGTAVTPFMSLLEHYKSILSNGTISKLGPIDFYFGIRNEQHDYLFADKLKELFDYFQSQTTGKHIGLILIELNNISHTY